MPLEEYLEELRDPKKPLLASKLSALSFLSADESSSLATAWPGIDVGRRRQILKRLLDLAEDNVEMNFDSVFITALKDEDGEARRLAVQGLWEYEGRDLIGVLIEMLKKDPEAGVRAEAALALGSFVLRAELQRLSAADSKRIEVALHAAVDDADEVVDVRARAVESVGTLSLPWVRGIIEGAYRSGERRLRLSAVHAMGRNCDPHWFSQVTEELASDDAEMRYEAATACAACCGESAVPHLQPLLEDEDPEVQEAAIAALGEIGGAEAKRALRDISKHPEPRVREAVTAALEEMDFNEDPLGFRLS